jgi:hypothetical protein
MAKAAAPSLHSKLASIEHLGLQDDPGIKALEVRFVILIRRFVVAT